MVPEPLLQRADNKTKIQNSHPQTPQTPLTSNCKQSRRPGKGSQRDTGSRRSEAAGSSPATEPRVPGLVCPHWHVQSRGFFSSNIHIAQGEGCLRRETDKAKDRKCHQALSHDGVFYETLIDYGGLVSQPTDEDRLCECPS